MPTFNIFATEPTDSYLRRLQGTGAVWIFHHIPKTAGSSVTHELRHILPPYRNIHADHQPGQNRADALMVAVDKFVEDNKKQQFRSASGHLRLPNYRRLREALPNARFMTILRHPAARLISDYRYAKTDKHPLHAEFSAEFPTIEDYVENDGVRNKMWKFLAPPNEAATPEAIGRIFDRYAFIGMLETLEEDWAFFSALIGHPKTVATRVNVTQNQTTNRVAENDALLERIREQNEKDFALYEAVERVLTAKREDMRAFVDQRRREWAGEVADLAG